ncbi:50S ribosomal protein L6 [Fulvivirgaceae bacterium PWU4]|uniref:Large ribosomal subunit protein uL6 n=1 Tax=Chryseosolibacter histidini TaxID=2782349 RepID=A0AAP2DKA2_9BACT|nr:50S ribosomal protein L6 [Chryseosolibacter histidini]MBT1696552.1 50S ribosomal protein L6 [Chryseosolibacter histidini]
MSRIGKKIITLPAGITFNFSKENHKVSVKGPKGELHQAIDPDFTIKQENGTLLVERPTDQKRHKSMHGLYRALIANMIEGVSKGYKTQMELVGVGYKANAQSNVLELSLGYSHNVFLAVPSEIKVQAFQEKGGNPTIVLEGIDKQLIGQVAAKIKSLRKVEPYKGKGIRFTGEYVRRKAGKAAAK